MNKKLKNISSSELIDELIERQVLTKLICGIYRPFELKVKYDFRDVELPKGYPVYIDSSVEKQLYKGTKTV